MTEVKVDAKPVDAPKFNAAAWALDLAGKKFTKLSGEINIGAGGKVLLTLAPSGDLGSSRTFQLVDNTFTLVEP